MANLKKNFGGNSSTVRHTVEVGPQRVNKVQSHSRISTIKRPLSAPVSMQGWLHKQGSEGLMLWKKRWFVLSEYCLFYYKNSEEDKILGSILLPSYKISPCTSIEGKLFRKKHSFKAEHANMRTYYFAADSRERMVQWMNAMSLATIAQDQSNGNIGQLNHRLTPQYIQKKKENFDFSISNNRQPNAITPKNDVSRNETCLNNSDSYVQPLYVNAPPKPRRTVESLEQNYSKGNFSYNVRPEEFVSKNQCNIPRQYVKKMLSNVPLLSSNYHERKTPDTYEISPPCERRFLPPKSSSKSVSDYEELYNHTASHAYYEHEHMEMSRLLNNRNQKFDKFHLVNRPHSVDFLQSEEKNNDDSALVRKSNESTACKSSYVDGVNMTPPRPKSSIDVISSDGFHWSEEQYAENMRKSAQYLVAKTNPSNMCKSVNENKSLYNNGNIRVSADFNLKNVSKLNHIPRGHHNSEFYKKDSNDDYTYKKNEVDFTRSKSARISREKQFNDDIEKHLEETIHKRRNSLHLKQLNDRNNQQVQQREESMKRLLEWKQRMLQSPLSRKSSGSSQKDATKYEVFKNYATKNLNTDLPNANSAIPTPSEYEDKNNKIQQYYYSASSEKEEFINKLKKYSPKDYDHISKARLRSLSNCSFDNSVEKRDNEVSSEDEVALKDNEDKMKEQSRISSEDGCERNDMRMSSDDGSIAMQENHSHNFMMCQKQCSNQTSVDTVISTRENSFIFLNKEMEDKCDIAMKMNSRKYSSSLKQKDDTDSEKKNINVERECLPQNIVQDRIKVFEKPFSENTFDDKNHLTNVCPMITSLRAEFSNVVSPLPTSSILSTSYCSSNNEISNDTENQISELCKIPSVRESCIINGNKTARDLLLDVDWKMSPSNFELHDDYYSDIKKTDDEISKSPEVVSSTTATIAITTGSTITTASTTTNSNIINDTISTKDELSPEDHYLPMAPSKKPIFTAPGDLFYHTRSNSASSASQIMILETLLSEDVENSYVEMTVGKDNTKAMYQDTQSNTNDNADLVVNADKATSAISTEIFEESSDRAHYEFLYKASSCGEPLYMEVFSKEKLKMEGNKKEFNNDNHSMLPDILNSSNTTITVGVTSRQLNDNSDADDEASKELDPLDLPQHPRFSLSDTFRPASYYLGGGGNLGFSFEQPDSSDSDLVSPPPIPTNPIVLEGDFNASLDLLPAMTTGKDAGWSENADLYRNADENISLSENDSSLNSKSSIFSLKELSSSLSMTCKDTSDIESGESYSNRNGSFSMRPPFELENNYEKHDIRFSDDNQNPLCDATRDYSHIKQRSGSESVIPEVATSTNNIVGVISNFDVHLGAPYYYSDILKMNENDKLIDDIDLPLSVTTCGNGTTIGAINNSNISAASTVTTINTINNAMTSATLNNKREHNLENATSICKRNNVGKKVNRICNEKQGDKINSIKMVDIKNNPYTFQIDYKNPVDDKNIYNSDVFQNKLRKVGYRSRTPDETLNQATNFYTHCSNMRSEADGDVDNRFIVTDSCQSNRRSRSFERLLDIPKCTSDNDDEKCETVSHNFNSISKAFCTAVDNDLWEKDSAWRESLRKTSLRHARSLDDLDKDDKQATMKSGRQSADILSTEGTTRSSSASLKKITRDVTYVNDCVSLQIRKAKQNPKEYTEDYREIRKIKRCIRLPSTNEGSSSGHVDEETHYERLDPRATITRSNNHNYYYEGGRDSTTVADNMKEHGKHNMQPKTGAQSFLEEGVYPTKPPSFEIDREKLRQWDLMSSAPAITPNVIQKYPTSDIPYYQTEQNPNATIFVSNTTPPNSPASGSVSATGCNQFLFQNRVTPPQNYILQDNDSKCSDPFFENKNEFSFENRLEENINSSSSSPYNYTKKEENDWNLNVSAGELLGRTHEELVLLLIQLRRQSASLCKAIENCHCEIESQCRLIEMEKSEKMENILRLAELKSRLVELEKQYEKGKPLVNLVDNMVKLGSLYRAGVSNRHNQYSDHLLKEKLEFNHKIQEQRLLAEERKEWERISPDHSRLQAKVEELYKLDRELQQESNLLQSLKQDKDLLEYALGGLKYKILSIQGNPSEMERYKRQQLLLEQELSHVRSVLARNSKKLEETVAANAKLEAELVVLRQKLQWNQRSSQEDVMAAPTVTALESELRRVQMLVGNLQHQRNELNAQVRQLTEKSKNLCHQMKHNSASVINNELVSAKKKGTNSWIETDIDNGVVYDVAADKLSSISYSNSFSPTPNFNADYFEQMVYQKNANTCANQFSDLCQGYPPEAAQFCEEVDISESDEKVKKFYGIMPKEKSQEIKTVRIVKRESERRQRDRDRGNIGIPVSINNKRCNMSLEENGLNKVLEEKENYDLPQQENEIYSQNNISFKSELLCSKREELTLPLSVPKISDSLTTSVDENEERRVIATANHSNINEQKRNEFSNSCQRNDRELFENKKITDKTDSPLHLSPVYQSEAAKEIVQELVLNISRKSNSNRRTVPKEKRRHHTISNNKPILPLNSYKGNTRARDDVDMERALRPRLNGTPDVVRSTLCRTDIIKYHADTIDNVLGTPGKILIPERYIPENMPELSPEEQDRRLKKAEAIRKMLSETTTLSATENETEDDVKKSFVNKNKYEETKRQRDHILQLNQILAQQVMEKSKLVAGNGLSNIH